MSTLYSIGSMNQLGDAFERAGFSDNDITKLKQFKELSTIRDVLSGKASIVYPEHFIDTDAAPFERPGFKVEKHIGRGLWQYKLASIELFRSEKQKRNYQEGNKLKEVIEALKSRKALNANVLDYLLAHPELIPESWKGKAVFFWGTIYRYSNGNLCVRYLYWSDSRWYHDYRWLDGRFGSKHSAALTS